jgi:hypothetical protein
MSFAVPIPGHSSFLFLLGAAVFLPENGRDQTRS